MKAIGLVAGGLALGFIGWVGASPAHAQAGYPYPPAYAYPPSQADAPSRAPGVWQYNPQGSNYAPNGSTAYGPVSQDYMNTVTKDGGNGPR
jgi:hypothetical protein